MAAFPLGMSLLITVEFYNSIGEKFHAQHAQLHLSVNRYGPESCCLAHGERTCTLSHHE